MAIHVPNSAYDAYFAYFAACTRQDVTTDSGTPESLGNSIANVTLASGDYSVGAGTPSGRRMTIAEKPDITVTADGTSRHVVLSLNGEIRLVTTCNEREWSNTLGDKMNMGSWYLQLNAPA